MINEKGNETRDLRFGPSFGLPKAKVCLLITANEGIYREPDISIESETDPSYAQSQQPSPTLAPDFHLKHISGTFVYPSIHGCIHSHTYPTMFLTVTWCWGHSGELEEIKVTFPHAPPRQRLQPMCLQFQGLLLFPLLHRYKNLKYSIGRMLR